MDFCDSGQLSAKQAINAAPTITPEQYEYMSAAAEITNKVMKVVISECKPGQKVYDICVGGDVLLEKEIAALYSDRPQIEKGIAFPTCVSINNCVGNYSPITDEGLVLNVGDVVKMYVLSGICVHQSIILIITINLS